MGRGRWSGARRGAVHLCPLCGAAASARCGAALGGIGGSGTSRWGPRGSGAGERVRCCPALGQSGRRRFCQRGLTLRQGWVFRASHEVSSVRFTHVSPALRGHLYLLSCYRLYPYVSIRIYSFLRRLSGRSLLIFEVMVAGSRSRRSVMCVPPCVCVCTDGSAHTCIRCSVRGSLTDLSAGHGGVLGCVPPFLYIRMSVRVCTRRDIGSDYLEFLCLLRPCGLHTLCRN